MTNPTPATQTKASPPNNPPPGKTTLALGDDGSSDMERAVRRGVALLDEVNPQWRDKVDARNLDMHRKARCVGAMLYGRFGKAMMTLFPELKGRTGNALFSLPVHYGFVAPMNMPKVDRESYHHKLTGIWKRHAAR